MPQFETFRKRMTRPTESMYVSIQRRGVFSINHAAFEALGAPEAVELVYAPAERIVGIRPSSLEAPDAYPVRRNQAANSQTYYISGQAFTNYYRIDTERSLRWPAYMEDGILCIDLNSEGETARIDKAPTVNGTSSHTDEEETGDPYEGIA